VSSAGEDAETGWRLCEERDTWLNKKRQEVRLEFGKSLEYLEDYDEWRFYADLEGYPDECYEDMKFYRRPKRNPHHMAKTLKINLKIIQGV